MKSYMNAALCAGFIMAAPLAYANTIVQKSDWKSYAQEKATDAYLISNRICDGDFFPVWPILGSIVGYDFDRSVDIFLKINAVRLVVSMATQQFEHIDQARSSIAVGLFLRLAYATINKVDFSHLIMQQTN